MFNSVSVPVPSLWRQLPLVLAAAWISACAALPSSGPTGAQIRSQVAQDASELGITLVQVETVNDLPQPAARPALFAADYTPPAPTEMIGPGDMLNITIYETGVALFGQANLAAMGESGGRDTASRSKQFPSMRVSDEGKIRIPFVGALDVAGKTASEVEVQLRQALRGKSQNPQVMVSIVEGLTNSVIVGGDVLQPGRLELPTNRESLSEVIALAGGTKGDIHELIVRVSRKDAIHEWRLSDVFDDPSQDIRIFPSDRISLVKRPQSFSVLGAAGQTNQFPFPAPKVSLIEAVSMAGGANPGSGNSRAIFVFRIDRAADGTETPTVYHFNMMQASSFILAQKFHLKDKDVVYVGNAQANQATKLVSVLSQLFFPLVALQQAGAL